MKFSQKIAKQIAQKQFDDTIDCVLGITDPNYHFNDDVSIYEQNFEEDLQELGINPTTSKINSISEQYVRMVDKAINLLKKLQSP